VKAIHFMLIAGLALMLALSGCTKAPAGPATQPATVPSTVSTPSSGIANPAAVYCTQKRYQYEIRTNPDGSQYGVCILPDGTVCDEWAFYRHTCPAPLTTAATPGAAMANPSAVYCVSKNYTYQIVTNTTDGSQSGVCVFPGGKSCDGWAYFRGECNETTAK
jgi:putative hemolysin